MDEIDTTPGAINYYDARDGKPAIKLPSQGAKFDQGKLRYDLIPEAFLEELARVYTIGASKYGDGNWKKGLSFNRMKASMYRHMVSFFQGQDYDEENGQHALAAVAFYCAAIIYFQHKGREDLDDRGER